MKMCRQSILRRVQMATAAILVAVVVAACGGVKSTVEDEAESLIFGCVEIADTAAYRLSPSTICQVVVKTKVEYPLVYVDSMSTITLQSLYAYSVLNSSVDSAGLEETIRLYADSLTASYGEVEDEVKISSAKPFTDGERIMASVNISPVYNQCGILTFCREVSNHLGNETMTTSHTYINLSTKAMNVISMHDIFYDESLPALSEMIKQRLLEQNGVKSEQELIDLGYFRLDNVCVNDNFRITSDGIIWTFPVLEIACYSIGEVEVELEYEQLKPYIVKQSMVDIYL